MFLLVYQIGDKFFQIYSLVCLVYCLLSWMPNAYNTTFGRLIIKLAEPYMSKFSKLPLQFFGIDFSPWIAIFVLQLARQGFEIVIMNLLYMMY
ncbi:YggT family protein [Pilibacter termitis]|uniref:YggT family protein n=1 Tax=Pilibacter termitis TaxID=263852 RepID=A0A1T4M4S3_9ENTE|nr:YggT family protein [Pilibacter termitis]SJZ61895.1 YggT family protein [Pilibacter termitis]